MDSANGVRVVILGFVCELFVVCYLLFCSLICCFFCAWDFNYGWLIAAGLIVCGFILLDTFVSFVVVPGR